MQNSINFQVRTRFAPSPTGFMHIGNLRSALYAYLIAKLNGGKFILRIEDTDRIRYVKGSEEIIYKTLKSVKIEHDEGPDIGGDYGPYVQSKRLKIYLDYAYKLVSLNKAYYCFCEKNIDSFGYDRKCRNLTTKEITDRLNNNKKYVIRQRTPIEGVSKFSDMIFGEINVDNSELEDQILIKSDGFPTYNFANVIDDHEMSITHVIRGVEYLSSTPKYNLIYESFGWSIPKYVHLPLIMGVNSDGTVSKLSKRVGSFAFESLIEDGFLPEVIINYIALLGWSPKNKKEFFSLKELEKEFKIEGIGKSPAIFDYNKLLWMNSKYIRSMNLDKLYETLEKYILTYDKNLDGDNFSKDKFLKLFKDSGKKILKMLQSRLSKISEFVQKIGFLLKINKFDVSLFYNKKAKTTPNNVKDILENILKMFKVLEVWNYENICKTFDFVIELSGSEKPSVMWVARIAVSGLVVTPGGAPEIFEILGKKETVKRLNDSFALFN